MKKNKPGSSKSSAKGFSPFKENKPDARKTDAGRPFARFEKKPRPSAEDAGEEAPKRKSFGDREKSDRKPLGDRDKSDRKPYGDKKSFDKSDRKPFEKSDRKPFGDREKSDRKPFEKSDRKPFGDRDKSDRKPFEKSDRKPFGDRDKSDRKPFEKSDRKPFGDRDKSDRKPFEKSDRKPFGDRDKSDRKPFDKSDRKPFGDRDKSDRKPFEKSDRKPFGDRDKSDRKPFEKSDRKSFGDKDKSSDNDKADFKGKKKDAKKPYFNGVDIFAKDKSNRENLHEDLPDFAKDIDDEWTNEKPYHKPGTGGEKGRRPEGKDTRKRLAEKNESKSGRKRIEVKDKSTKASGDEMPLNKYLAHSGLCSRRKAVDYIKEGKVTVNGVQVLEPATKVTPKDLVKLNEKKLTISKNLVYVLLNKPKGYITTTDDPEGRQTVMELVTDATDERVFPVGRLDRNTSGLLLLTNDGDLAQKLAHPKHNIKKIYHVGLDKPLTKADFEKILSGVELEDGVTLVDALGYVDNKDKAQIGIEIHSGKNRIVRRIFEHLEYKVEKLDRVMYAGLTKKNINRGKWRFLTEKEVILLKHFK